MTLEIGERVIFRSLPWEVADNASESYVELYGRGRENRGRTVRVILGLEPIQRAQVPDLTWTLGGPRWDHTEWKALHDAYRLTLSHGSLIRLLDPYAVVDPDRLDPAIVRPLIVRRLKPQVVKADGSRFLRRQIHVLDVEPYRGRAERGLDRGLREYTRLLRRRAQELEEAGERSLAMGASFLETFLRKRLASSAYACEISLRNRLRKVRGEDLPLEAEDTPEDRSQKDLLIEVVTLPDGRTEE